MTISQMLFSFTGRINRAKYWLIGLCIIVAVTVAVMVLAMAGLFGGPAFWVILIALYIPVIWASWAVGAKRLHDRNKSGWWLLLFYIAPTALQAIGNQLESPLSLVFNLPALAIFIWMIVELGFLRGTDGPNEYGPDPLQPASATQPA